MTYFCIIFVEKYFFAKYLRFYTSTKNFSKIRPKMSKRQPRRKGINFLFLSNMHFESTDSSAVVCELQSELVAQAVASLSTGFSAADACTFFSKTTHNVPKSLPLLPCFGSAIVVEPIGEDDFSCGPPTQVLKSNIPSPFGCSFPSPNGPK